MYTMKYSLKVNKERKEECVNILNKKIEKIKRSDKNITEVEIVESPRRVNVIVKGRDSFSVNCVSNTLSEIIPYAEVPYWG